jgi:hypothetical protein
LWRRLWLLCGGLLARQHIAVRLHFGEVNRRGLGLILLDAYDAHDGAARAKLRARALANLDGLRHALAVQKCAEARIGVHQQVAPILKTNLGVAARDHGPLRLVKDDLTLGGVASDLDDGALVYALGLLLPVTLF